MQTAPSASVDFTATTPNGKASTSIDKLPEASDGFSASLRSAMPQQDSDEHITQTAKNEVLTVETQKSDIEPAPKNRQANRIPIADADNTAAASDAEPSRQVTPRVDQAKVEQSHRQDSNTDQVRRHKTRSTDPRSSREERSLDTKQPAIESSEQKAALPERVDLTQVANDSNTKTAFLADPTAPSKPVSPPFEDDSKPDMPPAIRNEGLDISGKADISSVSSDAVTDSAEHAVPGQKETRSTAVTATNRPMPSSTQGSNDPAVASSTAQTVEQPPISASTNQPASSPTSKSAPQIDQATQRAGTTEQARANDKAQATTLATSIKSSKSPPEKPSTPQGLLAERPGRPKPSGPESLKHQLTKRANAADREQAVSTAKAESLVSAKADSISIRQSSVVSTGLNEAGADRMALSTTQSQSASVAGKPTDSATSVSLPDINTPLNPEDVSEAFQGQLGERLLMAVRQDMTRAEIRINPNELGPITIELVVDGNSATVSFGAENASTRNALTDSLSSLRDQLAREGLSLGEASVGEQPNRSSDQRDREQQMSRWTELRGETSELSGEPPLPQAYRPPVAARGLVDLFA